ncbi:hypothetical protein BU17DRAFT_43251 [Hysterangium stoloniferum]|nr:hypothetical protein BU17DRAFT_43251 [Hysterangium stoloniferum]
MSGSSTLSNLSAVLLSALITGSYVGGLYISRSGRLTPVKSSLQGAEQQLRRRDDEKVIRARLKAAFLSTCLSCSSIYLFSAVKYQNSERWTLAVGQTINLLGLNLWNSVTPAHFLVPLLYTGPLVARCFSKTLPFQHFWSWGQNVLPIFNTWIGLRNFVVAPITEEMVFRACLLAVAQLSGQTLYHKVFLTPLWFGVAHLHHANELYVTYGRTPQALKRAFATCMVQFTYTTLFGAYASFLLVRTGSVLPPITAHIFANIMGLPQPGYELAEHLNRKHLIIAAYIVGIVSFYFASGPWTA